MMPCYCGNAPEPLVLVSAVFPGRCCASNTSTFMLMTVLMAAIQYCCNPLCCEESRRPAWYYLKDGKMQNSARTEF